MKKSLSPIRPRLRYGAGVLFPQGVSIEKSEDVESAETTGFEVEIETEETDIDIKEDRGYAKSLRTRVLKKSPH